jgi:hypothetical protein
MWFIRASFMKNPGKRFNAVVEQIHEEFRTDPGSGAGDQRDSSATSSHSISINRSANAK